MRQLLPECRDEALDELYGDLVHPDPPADRPHVALGMVASLDGAATVEGRTAGLGGEGDHRAYIRLRETCDAILVGAGTVRTEDYGPPVRAAAGQRRRRDRGLAPRPELVIVTAGAGLAPEARVFSDPGARPLVATTSTAAAERRAALAEVAEVLELGETAVDPGALLSELRHRGLRWVLCEGGPTLNADLLAAGLVDELFLTVAPTVVGGSDPRIVTGPVGGPRDAVLLEAREHGCELLLRYRFTP